MPLHVVIIAFTFTLNKDWSLLANILFAQRFLALSFLIDALRLRKYSNYVKTFLACSIYSRSLRYTPAPVGLILLCKNGCKSTFSDQRLRNTNQEWRVCNIIVIQLDPGIKNKSYNGFIHPCFKDQYHLEKYWLFCVLLKCQILLSFDFSLLLLIWIILPLGWQKYCDVRPKVFCGTII